MVVGGQHHIETGILKRFGITVGSRKTRVAAIVRPTSERHLKIDHRIIGACYIGGNVSETFIVVIAASDADAFLARLIELTLMLHGIAGKQ